MRFSHRHHEGHSSTATSVLQTASRLLVIVKSLRKWYRAAMPFFHPVEERSDQS
jgi:hypothetical protein